MSKKRVQLFCIPFAGGSAASFKELNSYLDEAIDVHAVEYPGRGMRIGHPFVNTMDELVQDVKDQIEANRIQGIPFALLGYSMGVEVAFNLAQFMLEEKPSHLFFAAREAIQLNTKGHDYALLSKEQFIDKIVEFGGVDERILNNKRFCDIYMRPVYADYKLLHEYVFKSEYGKLNSDLTVFYCEKDTPFAKIKGWSEHTSGNTVFYEMGDNHFFIKQHAKEMAETINLKLNQLY